MIRTCDLIVPSDALYQTELHPDIGEIWKNRTFFFAATTQRSAFELISPGGSSQNRTASPGSSDQRAHQLRQRSKLFGYTTEWCGIRGSNPNVLRPLILSQCCLPIPAIPHLVLPMGIEPVLSEWKSDDLTVSRRKYYADSVILVR